MASPGKAVPIRRRLTDTGAETVRGIVLVTAGYVMMAIGDGSVKWAIPVVGMAGAMIGRAVFGMPTVLLVAGLRGRGGWRCIRPVRWKLVALRSVLHCISSLFWYLAWAMNMPLVDSYAIGFCTPLLMTVAAVPLLGERLRWRRTVSILIGFAGILVMLRPGGSLWTPAALAMLGALPPLVVRILIRLLATTETAECLTFWMITAHLPAGLLLWIFLPILEWAGWRWWRWRWWALPRDRALAAVERVCPGAGRGAGACTNTPVCSGAARSAGCCSPNGQRATPCWAPPIVIAAGLYNLRREQARRREEMRAATGAPGVKGAQR